MKLKQLFLIIAVSAVSAVSSVWIYSKVAAKQQSSIFSQSNEGKVPVNYAGFFDNAASTVGEVTDFTKAANAAVPAVVHIKTKIPAKKVTNQLPRNRGNSMDDFFEQFFNFGPQIQPEQRASGSGVIISDDGYIITNNHVISDGGEGVADEITVTLSNKKTYKAKVIGKDPSSDIAVLKIDGTGFPFLLYGNSDNVKLGQWVLAIGYPLTLETTVTAGIVSAKGRSIGINGRQSQTPIESFIQTDAAVNQGNSGGALITTDGQLIGINSAIYAPTGTYAGYSFAIPVNLAKKIVNDLIKFGDVKRPYLGIAADQTKVNSTDGAYIGTVAKDGAAAAAGLKKGDIIKKINDVTISSWSELQGTVASLNTGEKVNITYKRDGKEYTTSATLKAETGTYDNLAASNLGDVLGAELENLDKKTAEKNEVEGGVVVKKIKPGGPFSKTRMQDGFIITSVNGVDITNTEELSRAIASLRSGSLNLEGFYDGYDGMYRYPVNLQLEDE
ncbi:MAG: trypsin-like peptidase domain-containing protein [Chitinophagaceae bacterium]|nr:trypsin-like peptidase domain-containing protein [Chitinophagaceae bacterium]MBL0305380.1 trypsin-like peptidase domain-containing protein [Chitinophagaceae bacterium]HQV59201.1 trypsin-like peptidase domain-containing protein [Chitinophagaceae bacterium]HQV84648.1 trypsin-like peptidase domain-containing protein [Chitinophagaceae bacterium]HQX73448.1 trypsin-like peptidase domain-containing protein [Chitinophagaceae bacterium]